MGEWVKGNPFSFCCYNRPCFFVSPHPPRSNPLGSMVFCIPKCLRVTIQDCKHVFASLFTPPPPRPAWWQASQRNEEDINRLVKRIRQHLWALIGCCFIMITLSLDVFIGMCKSHCSSTTPNSFVLQWGFFPKAYSMCDCSFELCEIKYIYVFST